MTAPDSGAAGPAYGHGAAGYPPPAGAPGQVRTPVPSGPYGPGPQAPAGPVASPPIEAPPVPPGPGVRPPFAAPPVHKEGGTLALWLILGGFTLLLCLVGGGIGVGGAVVSAFNETDQEARTAAGEYLDALAEERYSDAYRMTCRPLRREVDEAEFVASKRQGGRVVDYDLSTIQAMEDGRLMVPATLRIAGGGTVRIGLVMAREPVDGSGNGPDEESRFRVCGEVDEPAPAPS